MSGVLILAAAVVLAASDLDEFKIKRENVFEFAQKPAVTRAGDRATIAFETKGLCDVTVAIEDPDGKIVRHLASGVLGPNAPEPLQKNSRKQTLVWDGKDDKGAYIDDRAQAHADRITVRVSLGLKAQFERTLDWEPKKRAAGVDSRAMSIAAAPEGVYVFDSGQNVDHLRLFSHAGEYLRTIYPFPADKVKDVQGLPWLNFPQDGKRLPVKPNYWQTTFLSSGDNGYTAHFRDGRYSYAEVDSNRGEGATTDLAVAGTRIALASFRLTRLSTDGTTGGLPLVSPDIDLHAPEGKIWFHDSASGRQCKELHPHRFAVSPDGKTVYFARYIDNFFTYNHWQHGIYRKAYEDDQAPELFLGAPESGNDAKHFNMPANVACDAQGRLYVADHGNHRVQVFKPDGTLVTSIPVEAPVLLAVSPRTGELAVFSWLMEVSKVVRVEHPFVLRRFKSADDPKLIAACDLPISSTNEMIQQCADVDWWADPPTVWMCPGLGRLPEPGRPPSLWNNSSGGIRLAALEGDRAKPFRDFQDETRKAVVRVEPPEANRQRLYWDPRRRRLYVGEGAYCFNDAVVVDPATGKIENVPLPFSTEDLCFDADGQAYLRTESAVARYAPDSWKEIPWDYGEDQPHVGYNIAMGGRKAPVVSALPLPTNIGWHHGGMSISPRGNLAIGCLYWYQPRERPPSGQGLLPLLKAYTPKLYPGRLTMAAYGCEYIHVWDPQGQTLYQDAIPGLGTLNGVGIDNQDGLYVLSAGPRVVDGKPWFNYLAGTLMKFKPGKAKIVTDSDRNPVRLPEGATPKRPPDLSGLPGNAWVDGAEWFYGGVGWHGKNNGLGCGCPNTRFALDSFGRTFAPEMDRYSVAVLDTNGNLILRLGTYGNVDDGMPLILDGGPGGGTSGKTGTGTDFGKSAEIGASPRFPRSIGGDEIALMNGAYLATQTDHRLFIADIGNYRLLSVNLDYHATERVALKGIAEAK